MTRPVMGSRRRASVMILVMTLLGVLFVTGIAFLASVKFDADMIAINKRSIANKSAPEGILADMGNLVSGELLDSANGPFGAGLSGVFGGSGATVGLCGTRECGEAFGAISDLPGVHGLTASIEPYRDAISGKFFFRHYTDLFALKDGKGQPAVPRTELIDATVPSGLRQPSINPSDLSPVDSDGDGITDTRQFDVSQVLDLSPAAFGRLSSMLNPKDTVDGKVFLGMRVLPHGGMVNLNESHPTLIRNIFDRASTFDLTALPSPEFRMFNHRPSQRDDLQGFYSPLLEESMLRRRMFLPPQELISTLLQGDPLKTGEPYGGGDMGAYLFPPGEAVYERQHQFAPFATVDGLDWASRMAAQHSLDTAGNWEQFDRRHSVTTISHDTLLARGGRALVLEQKPTKTTPEIVGDMDLLERMILANQASFEIEICGPRSKPSSFECVDYPHTIDNNKDCDCASDERCEFDSIKGRLRLSLPWLDDAFNDRIFNKDTTLPTAQHESINRAFRDRLIHDYFIMLLRNARGVLWEEIECASNPNICLAFGETCRPAGDKDRCRDNTTNLTHRNSMIARTAASLTANMIDYMDEDDIPTRVALRWTDLSFNKQDIEFNGVPDNAGRSFDGVDGDKIGDSPLPGAPILSGVAQYVYGLEKQPYISEVVSVSDGNNVVARAIELYNPYDTPIAAGEYRLVETTPSTGVPLPSSNSIDIRQTIPAGGFMALKGDPSNLLPPKNGVTLFDVPTGDNLAFASNTTIYLVRTALIPGVGSTEIVVDQINLGIFSLIAKEMPDIPEEATVSVQRYIKDDASAKWFATVPRAGEVVGIEADAGAIGFVHTLGDFNNNVVPLASLHPVEVNFANVPVPPPAPPPALPKLSNFATAFPTTGSMLLLIRHANRSFDERFLSPNDLAFTSQLDEAQFVLPADDDNDPPQRVGKIQVANLIDNGRMPVFDDVIDARDDRGNVTKVYANHKDPADPPPVSGEPSPPGGLGALPWGQLVFDYFTALPLSSFGPYRNPSTDPVGFVPGQPNSKPRVDLNGLRVHGRIDINAAPWKVMAGLPLIPMDDLPGAFQVKIKDTLDTLIILSSSTAIAETLGEDLAKAIVAYRDARKIDFSVGGMVFSTGDYGDGGTKDGSRGWGHVEPAFRRGSGFLTVGELVNVRNPDASQAFLRMTGNELLNPSITPNGDYVKAIAMLVALGDWVTARSDVYTMYGTLRGDIMQELPASGTITFEDELAAAARVDSRAIRFQETIDRIPTFSGKAQPVRIGQRTVKPYSDSETD